MFLTLSTFTDCWQPGITPDDYAGHTEVKDTGATASCWSLRHCWWPRVIMVALSRLDGQGRGCPATLYTTAKANLTCAQHRANPAVRWPTTLAEPDPNAGAATGSGQAFGLDDRYPVGLNPRARARPQVRTRWSPNPGWSTPMRRPTVPTPPSPTRGHRRCGKGPNGSHAALPFGLDPARTPVMGKGWEEQPGRHGHPAWFSYPAARPAAGGLRPALVLTRRISRFHLRPALKLQ